MPFRSNSLKCSILAKPPEIMNGTLQISFDSLIKSKSKPFLVPSFSIEFKIISPAPRSIAFFIQSLTSRLDFFVPLCVNTSHLFSSTLLTSRVTVTHCDPNLLKF